MAAIDELVGQLLGTRAAAREYGVQVGVISELIRSGELPSAVIGDDLLVARADLEPLRERLRQASLRRAASPRTERVYSYLTDYAIANDGRMPTFKSIGQAVGMHKSAVKPHLRVLEQSGRIIIDRSTRPHRLFVYRETD